jgi:bifunctional DNA-binding transcriptional regulator/antitoxin component of YhaV-PrlF toxin-antitoxin module
MFRAKISKSRIRIPTSVKEEMGLKDGDIVNASIEKPDE